jgi:hypothetical protein
LCSPVPFLGPGCSSFGIGAFSENGPFRPRGGGLLVRNDYSWNKGASKSDLLFAWEPRSIEQIQDYAFLTYLEWFPKKNFHKKFC